MDEILAFFEFEHLPGDLRKVSQQCHDLAHRMAKLPHCNELVAGLRKLLEAKDCFVRAAMQRQPEVKA